MRNRSIGMILCVLAAVGAGPDDSATIFDGKTGEGWVTNSPKKPLPRANVQADGLNPHGSGGYIVVHETPRGDFVLDFDYKLSKGCNSGVFVRVGDLNDPVTTGLEVAIDDTTGVGLHDTGAFYDLAPAKANAQKPAGEWNHMTITAKGPKLSVRLNDQDVSEIDVDAFDQPGKRPDGSKHKFGKVVVKEMVRKGYLGFQDHGQDCWYKNIKIKDLN